MLNSVISTSGAWFMTRDTRNFYLPTPLKEFQYLRISIELIPQEIIDLCHLQDKADMVLYTMKSFVACMDYQNQVFLANKLLKTCLKEDDYFELKNTPGLFKNQTRPIWFTLTVDDFGVKYIGK